LNYTGKSIIILKTYMKVYITGAVFLVIIQSLIRYTVQ